VHPIEATTHPRGFFVFIKENEMQVCVATRAYLDDLVPMVDAFRQFKGQLSNPTLVRRFMNDRFIRKQSCVLIARNQSDQLALGYAQLYEIHSSITCAPLWLMQDLYVQRQHRRRGVGKTLLAYAEELADAAGASGVYRL
jgi:ribosomal protein S18 acetylase RimI-like enzyme